MASAAEFILEGFGRTSASIAAKSAVISRTRARRRSRATRENPRAACRAASSTERRLEEAAAADTQLSMRQTYEIHRQYSKYAPNAADDIDLQELMSRLSDFLLQSGFESQFGIYEMDIGALPRANHGCSCARPSCARCKRATCFLRRLMEQMLQNPDLSQNQQLRDLIDQIIQRMEEEGYITPSGTARAGDAASLADARRASRSGAAEYGGAF